MMGEPPGWWAAGRRGLGEGALVPALIALAGGSAVLYWLLWTPAYRLSERFEYSDLLFTSVPAVAEGLAAQLAALRALLPATVTTYEGTRLLFVGLLVALFGPYLGALWLLRGATPRGAVAALLGGSLAFQVVLLPLPGAFSTDLFSYAFYGEIAGRYGGSPYVTVPDDYPEGPLYLLINPLWRDAPAVYGPVWIAVSSVVGAIWGGQLLNEVMAYRAIADLCYWLTLGALWWALRRLRPKGAAFGLALYAWNPLVVFELGANGHNDGLLILFVVLSIGLAARGRAWLGAAALALSVATKYTTVFLLAPMLWWAARGQAGWRRPALMALAGMGALGGLALLYVPWWRGPATLGPLVYWLTTPLYAHHPPIVAAVWLRDLVVELGWLAAPEAQAVTFGFVRQGVRIAFLGYLALETLRLHRAEDLPGCCARVLLAFLLGVNTWVLPWYYTWPLALSALGEPRSRTAWLTVGLSATAPASMYWAQTHLEALEVWGFVVYLAPVAALGAWELWRRVGAKGAGWGYGALRTASAGGRKTSRAPGSTGEK